MEKKSPMQTRLGAKLKDRLALVFRRGARPHDPVDPGDPVDPVDPGDPSWIIIYSLLCGFAALREMYIIRSRTGLTWRYAGINKDL